MIPINSWQVSRTPDSPFLLQLNADNSITFMTADQARKIAAALTKVADDMDARK